MITPSTHCALLQGQHKKTEHPPSWGSWWHLHVTVPAPSAPPSAHACLCAGPSPCCCGHPVPVSAPPNSLPSVLRCCSDARTTSASPSVCRPVGEETRGKVCYRYWKYVNKHLSLIFSRYTEIMFSATWQQMPLLSSATCRSNDRKTNNRQMDKTRVIWTSLQYGVKKYSSQYCY